MDLDAPFTGTLLLPDKLLPHGDSPVELADGQLVAQIRWNVLAVGSFKILDAQGRQVAESTKEVLDQHYVVTGPDGRTLLELTLGWRGTAGKSTVRLADGGELTVKGATFRRRFSVLEAEEREVAAITPTSGIFSMRKEAYAFELREPVLSTVQAVALVQCLREAVKAARARARAKARARRR